MPAWALAKSFFNRSRLSFNLVVAAASSAFLPSPSALLFVASAIWAAAIVASAYLCSMLLSIPGAAGASFFWLPCIFMVTGAIWFGPYGWIAAAIGTFIGGALAGNPIAINIGQNQVIDKK